MPTLQDSQKRKVISQSNEQDHLNYLEYELAMEARRDEVTDMTERLTMPMETTFDFELRKGKLYSEFGTPLDDVVYGGYEDIKQKAKHRLDLAFEVVRRRLDAEEIEEVKTLEPGEKLVTFLPIPDDVREGKTTIDGYNRNRLKMLVRVSEREAGSHGNTFSITSLSLDGSDHEAIQAAARAVGHDIPAGLSSEKIVARRHRIGASEGLDAAEIAGKVRDSYDNELARTKGGRWYAGINAEELEGSYAKAYDFVLMQTDLIDQHMAFLRGLESRLDGPQLHRAKEDARYNLAAALDDRRKGRTVTSIADSGAHAREEGRNYDGDCSTGSNTATSVESQANSLGFKTKEEFVTNCPLCGEKGVKATRAGGTITCGSCGDGVDICTGEVIKGRKSKKIRKQLADKAMRLSAQQSTSNKKVSKAELIKAKYGDAVTERRQLVLGGEDRYLVDKEGRVIHKL
jgi:hypothetical protein